MPYHAFVEVFKNSILTVRVYYTIDRRLGNNVLEMSSLTIFLKSFLAFRRCWGSDGVTAKSAAGFRTGR
jgi:hypothetical protein